MPKSKVISGSLAIAIAAIMWGFDGVVLTPRLYNLNIVWVVFILHFLPFLLMNGIFFKQYRQLKSITPKDLTLFTLVAATGGAVGTLAIVKALFLVNFQHLSVVVLLQKLQPVFAILLAAIILKERITQRFLVWASIAIVAGYFLSFGLHLPNLNTGAHTVYASLYALLAAVCFGSSTVFSKMLLTKYSFKTVTFYRYGFTATLMLIVVLLAGQFNAWQAATSINWLFIVIISVTTGSGAIYLYYYGLNHVKAIASIIIELLFPVSAIVFDYLVNDASLSPVQWVSAGLLILAILKLNKKG